MAATEGTRAQRPSRIAAAQNLPRVASCLGRPGAPRASSMIARATSEDLSALLDIEQRCFNGDRISRRRFRTLLASATAETLVDRSDGRLRGYALVLFRRASTVARLYSFAVAPEYRRRGVGEGLLRAALALARRRRATRMRLEFRRDNRAARQLYQRAGFAGVGETADYYEDGMTALRMERRLEPAAAVSALRRALAPVAVQKGLASS